MLPTIEVYPVLTDFIRSIDTERLILVNLIVIKNINRNVILTISTLDLYGGIQMHELATLRLPPSVKLLP